MDSILREFLLGVRLLMRKPGFTALAVGTLALGIGGASTMFSIADAVLLRPLPFPEPQQLATVWERNPKEGYEENAAAVPNFLDWRQRSQSFTDLAAYTFDERFNLSGAESAVPVQGSHVSVNLLSVLEVTPILGRGFLPSDNQAGSEPVALIGHDLWQRRFGGDPTILGTKIKLDGSAATIVGVMPAGFQFPGGTGTVGGFFTNPPADIWLPLTFSPNDLTQRSNHWLQVIGRLRAGVTFDQASLEMNEVQRRIAEENPEAYVGSHIKLVPLTAQAVSHVRPALLMLLAAVGFVLLMACANVANLLLVRAAARRREMAIRTALGASRTRLLRQLLTESVALAATAAVVGSLLAMWGLEVLATWLPQDVTRGEAIGLDWRTVAFTVLISALAVGVFGLTPALQSASVDVSGGLKEGSRSMTAGAERSRLRRILIVSEFALALMLLLGAGLLFQSFFRLQSVSPGFRTQKLLTMELTLPRTTYPRLQRAAFQKALLDRVEALPGVVAAGAVTHLPLSGSNMNFALAIEGQAPPATGPSRSADYRAVSPDYFRTMGITVERGRGIAASDTKDAPAVLVINETLARSYFGKADPIGRRLTLGFNNYTGQVVGVIRDVHHESLATPAREEVYGPFEQTPFWGIFSLVVQTEQDPLAMAPKVQEQLRSVDADLSAARVRTMEQVLDSSVAQPRFRTELLGVFAGIALLLAAVGIYGVISATVSERTRDIGIRMALGAQRGDVLRMVLGQGMTPALVGLALGTAGALAVTRLLSSLLFEVSATDLTTFVGAAVLLSLLALLACYIPARRAAGLDPLVALREE